MRLFLAGFQHPASAAAPSGHKGGASWEGNAASIGRPAIVIRRSRPWGWIAPAALVPVALALVGCEQLSPNGESGTMALLRSGSEKVCVASDVKAMLHDLLSPKAAEITNAGSTEDKISAIRGVALSYELTTLQSFDKAVARASCSTTVRVSGAGDNSDRFPIEYQVSPSAENAGAFVVTASVDAAKAYATSIIGTALDDLDEERRVSDNLERMGQEMEEDQARLLATITPKWLVGTWIEASAPASNCAGADTMSFQANHVYEGRLFTGRWSLMGDKLHRIGSGAQGGGDETDTITNADPISFTFTTPNGNSQSARRCTRDEVAGADPTIIDHMDTPE